jgi:hypothetical protein
MLNPTDAFARRRLEQPCAGADSDSAARALTLPSIETRREGPMTRFFCGPIHEKTQGLSNIEYGLDGANRGPRKKPADVGEATEQSWPGRHGTTRGLTSLDLGVGGRYVGEDPTPGGMRDG